jgi:hypothetical protein
MHGTLGLDSRASRVARGPLSISRLPWYDKPRLVAAIGRTLGNLKEDNPEFAELLHPDVTVE